MTRLISTIFLFLMVSVRAGHAQQEVAWVQVEALPSLAQAQDRVRTYAARLPDVNGFSLGGGWYSVALGPYTVDDANTVLRTYRNDREIPRDAFIAASGAFRQQFWPIGANLLDLPAILSPQTQAESQQQQASVPGQTQTQPQEADETPRQARASEASLSRDERKQLQVMLKWAGFYTAAIDGAFGRGTRGSMARWQKTNNFEPTGILTTRQRAELARQYNAVLEGLGLRAVTDTTAGIEMNLPMNAVKFTRYSPPFAHFDASGDIPARVLLISQTGDQDTLFGLFDIMQTLEIVPENGPRERKGNKFTLVGQNDSIISYTEASLVRGEIKGFTLIWPTGDEERRTRLLSEMRNSFKRLDGAMDPAEGLDEEQNIDLVAGLEIRRPRLSRSGFYVDDRGTVVTTAEAVASCEKITLDNEYVATVLASDAGLGIAVLRADTALAPSSIAALRQGAPRLQSEVAVSGFSYEGVLSAPTLTFGTLSDIKGLNGETQLKRLALAAMPGDAGGPVFDDGGAVLGMLLPEASGARKLPDDVSFAADAEAIQMVLNKAGVSAVSRAPSGPVAPEDLTREAQGMTVLVSCW